ncbi:TonB-dependent receptor plug domain-containing protein [Myroides odoratus]|uniref:TonB-dependent receptor plug domain-containing protein n=1 Tax=Myroides odoratus TaxID=256 RepID=UPI0039B07024
MKKTYHIIVKLFWLIIICFPVDVAAQFTIHGKVVDKDMNAISGVIVYVENDFIEFDTNELGEFQLNIELLESVQMFIIGAYKKGYEEKKVKVVPKEKDIYVTINMGSKNAIINEIFIVSKKTSKEILESNFFSKNDLEVIISSPESSIISAISYLPGAQVVGETGELSVRGGDGNETKYLFDGMLMSSMIGSNVSGQAGSSRLSPALFKDMNILQGGYSVEYGNALSSIIEMTSKDVAYNKSMSILLSPFALDIQTALPLTKEKKASLEVGINLMNFDLYSQIMKSDLDYQSLKKGPYSASSNLFYKNNISENLKFKFFSNLSFTHIEAISNDIDEPAIELFTNIKNQHYFNQATIQYVMNTNTEFFVGINNTTEVDDSRFWKLNNSFTTDNKFSVTQLKTNMSNKLMNDIYLKSTVEYFIEQSNMQNGDQILDYSNNNIGIATELSAKLFRGIYAKVGIRGEYSNLLKNNNIGGRYDLKYIDNGNNHEIGVSYGDFFQQPPVVVYGTDFNDMRFSKANQFNIYYRYKDKGKTTSLDIYHKKYKNLLTYNSRNIDYDGKGFSKGFDVYFKDSETFSNFQYQISYSYNDAKRKYLNYPIEAPFHLSSRHKYSMAINYSAFKGSLMVGMFYNYTSGRHYFNPNLSEEFFNSDKAPDLHDLSSNLIYSFNIKNKPMLLILSVSNLLGANKVYGYSYSDNNFSNRREIAPMNNRFVFIGFNIAFGLKKNNALIDEILNFK